MNITLEMEDKNDIQVNVLVGRLKCWKDMKYMRK